jgi:hypothetical protein
LGSYQTNFTWFDTHLKQKTKEKEMKPKFLSLALVVFSFSVMGNSSKSFETILQEEVYEFVEVYPPEDFNINTYTRIEYLAKELNIDSDTLYELIHFETAGTMNPKIQNPFSSAKGLLQFTDPSARKLRDSSGKKYISSEQLITKCSTQECQLAIPGKNNKFGGPVYQYLSGFKNIQTKHDLYMAVFYPTAIGKKDFKFPQHIVDINPGIETSAHYVEQAEKRMPRR